MWTTRQYKYAKGTRNFCPYIEGRPQNSIAFKTMQIKQAGQPRKLIFVIKITNQ